MIFTYGYVFNWFKVNFCDDFLNFLILFFIHLLWLKLQLSPTDRSLQTEWEQEIGDAKEYVRKLNVISTNKDKEMEVEDEKDDFEVCFILDFPSFFFHQIGNDLF